MDRGPLRVFSGTWYQDIGSGSFGWDGESIQSMVPSQLMNVQLHWDLGNFEASSKPWAVCDVP